MSNQKTYFFCGVGGSGMMPLAVLMHRQGHKVVGSDRSYDQGKNAEKFQALEDCGIHIFPQDGQSVSSEVDYLVVSSAVEETIPDVKAAIDRNIPIIKRGELLAELFNSAEERIAVAGTSGKSTVTGMVGTVLAELGQDPTVVNGGEIRNFRENETDKFASIRKGRSNLFVAEMDESDGSIAHYNPTIALLNNIALDHKSMEELEQLFGDYLLRAEQVAVVNFDQPRLKALCEDILKQRIISYGIDYAEADFKATKLKPSVEGISFTLEVRGESYTVNLNVPGRHNVENALASLAVCSAMDIDIADSIEALEKFMGVHRRMELVGSACGVTVIDDFAHNPDKIAASLSTLKAFDGRLIIMFQPHGFGPLKLMGKEIVEVFAEYLDCNDILMMPEAFYAGGTTDRSVTAQNIVEDLKSRDVQAYWFAKRHEIPEFIIHRVRGGDRFVVMGARDDTLHVFAKEVLDMFC